MNEITLTPEDKIINLYKKLYMEYSLSVLEVEMELHKARTTTFKNRLQAYFNSGQNRNTFARIMTRAYITGVEVSITEICELLNANRSSVSVMVDECMKEGWITTRRESNKTLCKATEELYYRTMRYCHFKKKVNKSIVGDNWKKLNQLESVLEAANITAPDMSFKTQVKALDTNEDR